MSVLVSRTRGVGRRRASCFAYPIIRTFHFDRRRGLGACIYATFCMIYLLYVYSFARWLIVISFFSIGGLASAKCDFILATYDLCSCNFGTWTCMTVPHKADVHVVSVTFLSSLLLFRYRPSVLPPLRVREFDIAHPMSWCCTLPYHSDFHVGTGWLSARKFMQLGFKPAIMGARKEALIYAEQWKLPKHRVYVQV